MTFADPSAPFTADTAVTQWQFAPVVTAAVVVLGLLYLAGMWQVHRRHPARPWPWLRALAFFAGLGTIVLATQSSIGAYDDELFSVHMVQHLLLIMVAPILLVVGRPMMLALHACRNPLHRWLIGVVRSRVVTAVTCPPVATAVYAIVIIGTHLTSFMNEVLVNEPLHDTEHAVYLLAGYLYFLPLLGSEPIKWKLSFPTRFLLLALTMPVDTFVGVILLQTNHELFPAYAAVGRTWGPSLVADLNLGGAIMWVGGDGIMFVAAIGLFIVFLRDKRAHTSMGDWFERARRQALNEHTATAGVSVAEPARLRRGATVDDDEHLAAYNAYLASLGAGPTVPADSPSASAETSTESSNSTA